LLYAANSGCDLAHRQSITTRIDFLDTMSATLPSFWHRFVRRRLPLIIVFAVLQATLAFLLPRNTRGTQIRGDSVVLKATCRHPEQIAGGDEVLLTYSFSSQTPSDTGLADPAQPHQDIYVRLQQNPNAPHHHCAAVTWNKPDTGRFIKGRMTPAGQLQCGIEQLTVPEDLKQIFRQAVASDRLSVEITIDKSGRAVLRRFLMPE
jgi:uncharacterized membrane-anchored protein